MAKGTKFDISKYSAGPAAGSTDQEKPRRPPLKIVSLSVHDLIPSPGNFYSDNDIAQLKTSIEIYGVKQNLTVKPLDGGKYEIIAGHRRHKACLELVSEGKPEFEYVPCGIETERDEIKEQILLIMTNSTTRILTDYEKMQQALKLKEFCTALKERDNLPGRVRDMVAEIMQESTTQIARFNAIAKNLSPEFKTEMQAGRLGVSTAAELATLPPDKQQAAFEDYTQNGGNMSIKDAKNLKVDAETPASPYSTLDPAQAAYMQQMDSDIENMLANEAGTDDTDPDPPPEEKDFSAMTVEEKGEAAIAFLEGNRFKLFPPGSDTRVFDFIIDTLEHHVLR